MSKSSNLPKLLPLASMWLLISLRLSAQQLICPDPIGVGAGSVQPFDPDWDVSVSTGTRYVPTVIHLIGDAAGLTNSQVVPAINQLNADFADPASLRTVVFVLASIGPDGRCTNGIIRHPNIQYAPNLFSQIQGQTRWPNANYLNIWVVNDPEILGAVAVQPSLFQVTNGQLVRTDRVAGQSPNLDNEDGIRMVQSEIYPFGNISHTLTHETGHWLNLKHVFSPCESIFTWDPSIWNCCHDPVDGATQGDFIEDTPPQGLYYNANPNDCDASISTCGGQSSVTLKNFMSYGGPCIDHFTDGQREWMFHCLDNFRPDIWSDENLRCTGVSALTNPVIATGQQEVWDLSNTPGGIRTIIGTLTIEPGAALTIASSVTVQFCDMGKVVVKQGGRLNHYGKLTSSCAGRMWQGVEVWGNKSQSQYNWPNHIQGRFQGYSQAVIEHAVIGLVADNPADVSGNSAGGIVSCTGTIFKNNGRSVYFAPYENKHPFNNQVTVNFSRFTTCTFETNNEYRGDAMSLYKPGEEIPFFAFADLKGVRGIVFEGCSFQNNRNNKPFATEEFYGRGIMAVESDFRVTEHCSAILPYPGVCPEVSTTRSSFKNLQTGIWASNTNVNGFLPYAYLVRKAHFEKNFTGIRSSAGSRATIIQNTFQLGAMPPDVITQAKISGLILESSHTSFTVQENRFFRDAAYSQDVLDYGELNGIQAQYLGEMENLIRKNYFTGLKIGNRAIGHNATPSGANGLLYLCNENDNPAFSQDISVFDFKVENSPIQGRIKTIQARPGSLQNQYFPAGNSFSHAGPTGSESDFRTRFNIQYRHGLPTVETPIYYDPAHFSPVLEDQPRSCESIFCDPPCRESHEIDAFRQQITTDAFSRDSLLVLLALGGTDPALTQAREQLRDYLNHRIHTFAAEVAIHIAHAEGDNAAFRDVLSKARAYDADLELANDYIGSGETTNYHTLLNAVPSKYQLTGEALDEFIAYRAVTDMLAQHYANGGSKYDLGHAQIEWLEGDAEGSPYHRARSIARRILRIYGYLYPVDIPEEEEERLAATTRPAPLTPLFSVFPNPANQSVTVSVSSGAAQGELALIKLLSPSGILLAERRLATGGSCAFDVKAVSQGIYLIQVILNTGQVQTQRVLIMH